MIISKGFEIQFSILKTKIFYKTHKILNIYNYFQAQNVILTSQKFSFALNLEQFT